MPQKFSLSYHGSPFAEQIRQQGFRPGSKLSIAPGKVFSTPNVNFASGYGKPISMVTPRNAFSIPSMNLSTGNIGKEIIQNPGTATRQMGLASKLGTKYTGPTAQRLLAGEAVSGIGASQAGRSVLGRVLGAALGPAAGYASALAAPNMYMASMLDGPNVRSGAADEYVGMMGEAMPEEDYAGLADLLGMPEASQALDDEYYDFDKTPYSELDDFEAQNAGQFVPEEEKGLGELLRNLSGGVVNFGKDIASRSIASQALGGAGAMFNPYLGLAGMVFGGLKGGNMFGPSQSSRAYDSLNSQGRSTVDNIYGSGGIMSGYNPVSAFGRGPIGAIDNRIGNIYNRNAPQTAASQQKIQDLYNARSNIMQTTLDEDSQYTGPTSSVRGQKAGVMDDDPFATGPSKTSDGDAGGSSKIVCTMMNESYGFGNFRNKIWLKYARDNLSPEYEKGYHKIFLPLVKFAKGQGKLNKAVKKTLEHIARHRTLDLKQEMKGKTHLLGRIYRKILEPMCFIVGKVSKND